jgi:protein-tyrosine phosphatase
VIDLHAHLLPGVDDGAESLDEAVALCRRARAEGCTALVATPHRRRDEWSDRPRAELEALLETLRAACADGPALHLGAENRVDSELVRELAAAGEAVIPLAGSRYVLLELDPHGIGPDPVDLVAELVERGWRPVVAHPELTPFLRAEPEIAGAMVDAGAFLQVTAASVTGEFGRPAKEAAHALIAAERVHFVATDAHRPHWRPTGLARAHATLERAFGAATARALTTLNPAAVLTDRSLAAPRVVA